MYELTSLQEADAMQFDRLAEYQHQAAQVLDVHRGSRVEGEFDGTIGDKPREPENDHYWFGYQQGLRAFWLRKAQQT